MSDHFIRNIEIRNYKLFHDFKAKGFGRVNLIGGKNNVGKTAFLEALYITENYANKISNHDDFKHNYGAKSIDKEWIRLEFIKAFINIEANREGSNFITEWIKEEVDLLSFDDIDISINDTYKIRISQAQIIPEYKYHSWSHYSDDNTSLSNFRNNEFFYKIYKKNNPPQIINSSFITPCNQNSLSMKDMVDSLKLNGKYDDMTSMLNDVFSIKKIDVIKNRIMLKVDEKFISLTNFGDGIKYFLNVILALLSEKNRVVYLDEIENGIHYTNFDKLWEIILTLSKEQNVQVFATTHSKECIESYARVAKKLEDDEIAFVEMGINKYNKPRAIVMNTERFFRELETGNEVRGW